MHPLRQLIGDIGIALGRRASRDYEWTHLCPHCFTPVRRRSRDCRVCESHFDGAVLSRTELPTVPLAG